MTEIVTSLEHQMAHIRGRLSIGVARILSAGVHFFAEKVDDLFLVVAV